MLQPQKRPVAGPPAWAVPDWPGQAKEQTVQQMFTSIARFYDLNNSLLSFGLHHRWKHTAIEYLTAPPAGACGVRSDESFRTLFGQDLTAEEASGGAEPRYILDVGAGTGDLALLVEKRLGQQGPGVARGLDTAMVRPGGRKKGGPGPGPRISWLRRPAGRLGFRGASFGA